MKIFLKMPIIGALVSMVGASMAQKPHDIQDCLDKTTQTELNDCGKQDADSAERALNKPYQSIMKKYADRPQFIERLRAAQGAWLRFRDAQIAMRFPVASQQNPNEEYGSVYPMCYSLYKADLTRQRTRELRLWLAGIDEGAVCSGSVKRSEELK
jgi:uncharacterized protein YecT (DUF1311 family)